MLLPSLQTKDEGRMRMNQHCLNQTLSLSRFKETSKRKLRIIDEMFNLSGRPECK